jgi:hypothetical protein
MVSNCRHFAVNELYILQGNSWDTHAAWKSAVCRLNGKQAMGKSKAVWNGRSPLRYNPIITIDKLPASRQPASSHLPRRDSSFSKNSSLHSHHDLYFKMPPKRGGKAPAFPAARWGIVMLKNVECSWRYDLQLFQSLTTSSNCSAGFCS